MSPIYSPVLLDQFASDSITAGAYTFDTGSGTMTVSAGQIDVSSPTADKRIMSTTPALENVRVTAKHTIGTVPASDPRYAFQVVLKHIDADHELWAMVTAGSGTASQKRLVVGMRFLNTSPAMAAETLLANQNLVTAPVAGTSYWLRAAISGNVVTAEHWLTNPALGGSPDTTLTHTLSTSGSPSNASLVGEGVTGSSGLGWLNGDSRDPFLNFTGAYGAALNTSSHADDFRVEAEIPNPTLLTLDGDYGIGTPPRRTRTRPLDGDYSVLPAEATRILVLIDGELVSRPVQVLVAGVLV